MYVSRLTNNCTNLFMKTLTNTFTNTCIVAPNFDAPSTFRATCAYRPRADVREGAFAKMIVKGVRKEVRQEARGNGARTTLLNMLHYPQNENN